MLSERGGFMAYKAGNSESGRFGRGGSRAERPGTRPFLPS